MENGYVLDIGEDSSVLEEVIDIFKTIDECLRKGYDRSQTAKVIRGRGNPGRKIDGMGLAKLRRLHQILFEEAVRAGKEKFGSSFAVAVLRRSVDNTFEHMKKNMCSNPVVFCNRNCCDCYDPECVSRKIKDQIVSLISEILDPSSNGSLTRSKVTW